MTDPTMADPTGDPADGHAEPDGPQPPPPPREGGRVGRHAWTEPRVRAWWAAAIVMLLLAAYVCVSELVEWNRQRWLIDHGTPVDATVFVSFAPRPGTRVVLYRDTQVNLKFTWEGKEYQVVGYRDDLGNLTDVATESTLPIRIDPQNPQQRWTGRLTPTSPLERMRWGLLIPLPIGLVLLLVAMLQRAFMLRMWRDGEATAAVVVESRHTSLAPRSRAVRCTPAHRDDNRVLTVYVPPRAGVPRPGELIWMVRRPNNPSRAVAAAWMEERSEEHGGNPATDL